MWLFVTVPIQQTSRVDSVLAESHSSPQLRTRSGSVLAVTAFKTDGMLLCLASPLFDMLTQVEVDNVELVLAQVEVDLVVAQEQVEVGNDLPEVEVGNDLPEVGAHNIVNVRRRPRRRPFSKPLSPQSETRRQESLKKKTAVKKAQTLKEARLNAPNNTGLKKAQKTAFSKV
ncbi:hypothetical protein Bca4012_077136 [Brassica carinata]